jgi:hypothetical protein
MVTAFAILIIDGLAAFAVILWWCSRQLAAIDQPRERPEPPAAKEIARVVAHSEPASPVRIYKVWLREGGKLRSYTGFGRRPFRLLHDGQSWEQKGSLDGVPVYVRSDAMTPRQAQRKPH